MKQSKIVLCALVASFGATACSSPPTAEEMDAALKAATASALPSAAAQSIEVLNVQRSSATWRWNAKTSGKVYACDADNQLRLPSCEAIT